MELGLIILIVLVLYWRTMDYHYLIDDIVRRWGYLLEIPETSPDPSFYSRKPHKMRHMFLTLTHTVNSMIIYFIWGWKAALLFAVNPLAVSCTAWITGGYYQITTFFVLVAYFFLLKIPGIIGGTIAAIFFTGALGSTINCIAIPFIFLLFPPVSGLTLFWSLGFYLFGRRFRIGFRKRNNGKKDSMSWRKIFVVAKVLAYYIKDTVFPLRLAFFRSMGFEYGKDQEVKKNLESANAEFYKSLLIIIVFCAIGMYFSPFGLAWYMAGILPFTQWKVLGQFVAERYLYLPLVGWTLILAGVSAHSYLLFSIIAILYVYRAHKYIPAFKSIETLYENGIQQHPDCISNYVNLAERKLHIGKSYEAFKLLHQGLKLDPDSFLCNANLAAYWLGINRMKEGKEYTKIAMQCADKRGMAYIVFKGQLDQINSNLHVQAQAQEEIRKYLEEEREKRKAAHVRGYCS